MNDIPAIDNQRALEHLMDLLRIEGLSGNEGPVADAVAHKLRAAGVAANAIRHDRAHQAIGQGFRVGNLIVKLPGSPQRRKEPRRMFSGHLDTVPLCRGAVPKRRGDHIVSSGATALGGDNRTAVAAIVSMVEVLLQGKLRFPPTTLLFTVGEEVGLLGARHVKIEDLGNPVLGVNIDGGDPARLIVGAIGADRFEVDVFGKASHAGVHPEHGISATLIAARAVADVAARGYFGLVQKGRRRGTSNVGVMRGGEATNQVTDQVFVRGECRSHEAPFLETITKTYRLAFERAARVVRNEAGESGRVDFRARREYEAFRIDAHSPPVEFVAAAARRVGLAPQTAIANGGLDANYFNARGVPTVTIGAGQHGPHTIDEYVEVKEYLAACRLLLECAVA